ncbi:unnamed protein product [Parajaminaea phylloscopi]
MSSAPYTCKWGILATGGIAEKFVGDLLVDPTTRKVSDVAHRVVAAASSSSKERAQEFLSKLQCDPSTKAYGSYEELVQDPDVDIIYVATPHPFHYSNVLLCLENGKNVCCEKPFTINSKQAEHLIRVAKERDLFVMEAMWTRFMPAVQEILRLVHEEKILGNVTRVFSDLSQTFDLDPKSRIYDPKLGGGALLDVGVYPLTWQLLTLYQHPANARTKPQINATLTRSQLTGVDESVVIVGDYSKVGAVGIASSALKAKTSASYAVLIQGDKGDIRVPPMTMNPQRFYIELHGQSPEEKSFPHPGGGSGFFYEADAAARCLRDGKKETQECSHEDTLFVMRLLDEIRAKGGFQYPEEVEAVRQDA